MHFGQKRLSSILCNNSSRRWNTTKPCQANSFIIQQTHWKTKERGEGGFPQTSTASKHDLIGLKCKEVYTPNLCRRLLIKTKSSTELSTFPTVCLNFILTAKEINCHMPPNFFLQTSCAMVQKPQQKSARVSWSSAWLGINSHCHSEPVEQQHKIKTRIALKSRIPYSKVQPFECLKILLQHS